MVTIAALLLLLLLLLSLVCRGLSVGGGGVGSGVKKRIGSMDIVDPRSVPSEL